MRTASHVDKPALYFAVSEMPRVHCRCGGLPNGGELVLRSADGTIEKCRACAKGYWP